ncbi:MAG: hypothetical protein M1831_001635 [Alyxoria varia]|nr:MAG: hypothetical protein M1831_001635 [Alyxoria varia]
MGNKLSSYLYPFSSSSCNSASSSSSSSTSHPPSQQSLPSATITGRYASSTNIPQALFCSGNSSTPNEPAVAAEARPPPNEPGKGKKRKGPGSKKIQDRAARKRRRLENAAENVDGTKVRRKLRHAPRTATSKNLSIGRILPKVTNDSGVYAEELQRYEEYYTDEEEELFEIDILWSHAAAKAVAKADYGGSDDNELAALGDPSTLVLWCDASGPMNGRYASNSYKGIPHLAAAVCYKRSTAVPQEKNEDEEKPYETFECVPNAGRTHIRFRSSQGQVDDHATNMDTEHIDEPEGDDAVFVDSESNVDIHAAENTDDQPTSDTVQPPYSLTMPSWPSPRAPDFDARDFYPRDTMEKTSGWIMHAYPILNDNPADQFAPRCVQTVTDAETFAVLQALDVAVKECESAQRVAARAQGSSQLHHNEDVAWSLEAFDDTPAHSTENQQDAGPERRLSTAKERCMARLAAMQTDVGLSYTLEEDSPPISADCLSQEEHVGWYYDLEGSPPSSSSANPDDSIFDDCAETSTPSSSHSSYSEETEKPTTDLDTSTDRDDKSPSPTAYLQIPPKDSHHFTTGRSPHIPPHVIRSPPLTCLTHLRPAHLPNPAGSPSRPPSATPPPYSPNPSYNTTTPTTVSQPIHTLHIYTECQSAIHRIPSIPRARHLARTLHSNYGIQKIKLRWSPGHTGIHGNVLADRVARKAAWYAVQGERVLRYMGVQWVERNGSGCLCC